MMIDEIYSAALQGNHALLESLLSRRQANLNQMYDAGSSGGMRTLFPLLFSVLNAMNRRPVDYQVISLLVRYGADVNGFVQMESDGAVARLPFLYYAISEWNSLDMADCLLQNGADPNGVREVAYPGGGQSAMPMLCLALQNPDASFTDMLLRAGADPNQCADVYYPSAGYGQQLPPLYYALVEQQNQQKLSMLAAYGASEHFPITLGNRPEDSVPFKRYVQAAYPQLSPILSAAFSAPAAGAGYAPQQPDWNIPAQPDQPYGEYNDDGNGHDGEYGNGYDDNYARYDDEYQDDAGYGEADGYDDEEPQWDDETEEEKPAKKKTKKNKAAKSSFNLNGLTASLKDHLPGKKDSSEKPAKMKKAAAEEPPAEYDPNRRCYGKFIAYLFGNFGILTLAFMIIAPLIFMGSDSEMAMIFFCIGLPCFAICALLMWRVIRKAKRYRQPVPAVVVQFILDSLLMFVRFMLMMLVVTIPLVKAIGNDIQWEQRTTTSGRSVMVKKTGDGEYKDSFGKRYKSK